MNEMTTPTDTEKLAQALRESITNDAWIARIRSDYPEDTVDMGDETVREEYANGWKYADTWDHLGDAREDYERLADAYIELFEANESRAQPASVADWTDEQCVQFMCVGLRHTEYKDRRHSPTLEEIRQGARAALAAAPQPPANADVCSACDGDGFITKETPTMLIESPCPKCNGRDQ